MEWHKIHPLWVHLKSSQLTHTAWDGQALGWGWGSGWDLSNTSSPPPPPPQPWTICTHLFLTSLLGAVLKFLLGIFILFLLGFPSEKSLSKGDLFHIDVKIERVPQPPLPLPSPPTHAHTPPLPHMRTPLPSHTCTHTQTHTFLKRNSWLEWWAFIVVESMRQGFF